MIRDELMRALGVAIVAATLYALLALLVPWG
jgi:hypothetical protein